MTRFSQRVQLLAALILLTTTVIVSVRGGTSANQTNPKSQPEPNNKNPLIPKGPDDLISYSPACVDCHGRTPDDVKNSRFTKDYRSDEFVLLTESRTWEESDPHSRSFKVLKEPLARRMAEILKYDVTKSAKCLTCHGIDKYAGLPLPEGDFDLAKRFETVGTIDVDPPGVTCNVCHGLRKSWQSEHYNPVKGTIPWRTLAPDKKKEAGMRNLRHPVVKAQLCVSCHVGNAAEGKVVTHEMYAAGHPPLPPFELTSYMEGEPKHWAYPTDPRLKFFASVPAADRWKLFHFNDAKDESYLSRNFAVGAVVALRAEAELLLADAKTAENGGEGLDFARFDCYACHHDLKYPSDRQKRGYDGPPGRPTLRAAPGLIAGIVAKHGEGVETTDLAKTATGFHDKWIALREAVALRKAATGFHDKWLALRKAATARPFGHPTKVKEAAMAVIDWCDNFLAILGNSPSSLYTIEQAKRLRELLAEAATSASIADPEAAMLLAWGYTTLAREAGVQLPADRLKTLADTVPLSVRAEPYTVEQKPAPIQFGTRMKMLSGYQADPFRQAFEGLLK